MARLKYEFLAHYQAKHGVPLRSRLFAHVEALNRLASLSPRLANRLFANSVVRRLMDRILGIDRRRGLPRMAPQTFQDWLHSRRRNIRPFRAPRGTVILWDDIYLSYNEPEVGKAAVRVLEAVGFEVRLVAGRRCEGRPLISKGLLAEARRRALHNVTLLAPLVRQSIPIVGVEPSSITTFRDEYPDLLPGEDTRLVAKSSFLMEEFLARLADRGELHLDLAVPERHRHILLHGHCYQKSLTGVAPVLRMLRLLPATTVEEIQGGCCGMAGAFGYEREHYEISMACGEDRLFPYIRSAPEDSLIAAAGFSCRHQISHGTGREVLHPVVILANGLR
jgi:Fe-S oxidoreductase